jgi:tetratricopeptide (TPR) repeat protein
MAPEQFRGEATARTDQFGFSVALYEALYGERPFAGATVAELAKVIGAGRVREPPKGTRVPPWMRRAVLRGLRVDPEERYPSMKELLQELEHDPGRAWVRRGVAVALLALVATTFGVLVHARVARQRACTNGEEQIRSAWNDARKKAVHDAFVATKKPFADDVWRSVERTLDAYVKGWLDVHAEACGAKGSLPPDIARARASCLEERSGELGSLTSVLEHADDDVMKHAAFASRALTPLEQCEDARSARAKTREEGARDGRVRELRARLVEAKVLGDAGRFSEGRALAADVVQAARALGHRPTQAAALFLRGDLELSSGEPRAAVPTLKEAVCAADAAKDDFTRAQALAELMYVEGYVLRTDEPVDERDAQVNAAIERLGGDDELESSRAYLHGMSLHADGKAERARTELEKALDLRSRVFGPDSREVAQARNGLGAVLDTQERYQEALAQFEQVRATYERLLGPAHPEVAVALNNIGAVMVQEHRLEDALAYFERALRIYEDALGPDHPSTGSAAGNAGEIHAELGHHVEAIELLSRAVAIRERSFGSDSPKLAMPLSNLGKALYASRDYARAIECLERAERLGRTKADAALRFESLFFLGQALWEAGRDRARARTLVENARDVPSSDERKKTAVNWLLAHPKP